MKPLYPVKKVIEMGEYEKDEKSAIIHCALHPSIRTRLSSGLTNRNIRAGSS